MKRLLTRNDELLETGKEKARWQVLEATLRDGHIKVFDRDGHKEDYLDYSVIRGAIADGRLTVQSPTLARVSLATQKDTSLEKDVEEALAALRQVEFFQKTYACSFNKAYSMAKEVYLEGAENPAPFPSKATIYRYLKARRNGLAPFKGKMNKGNRTPRYASQVTELIVDAAERLYLKRQSRWSRKDITALINDQAHQNGWIAPTEAVSVKHVAKTIYLYATPDEEKRRMAAQDVPAGKAIANNRIVVTNLFERVEQDAVHMPFVVETPHGISSAVYLVHAIDCCTGMPVGWHFVIGNPNDSDTLKCVESILFSKAEKFAKLGLTNLPDVYGTPLLWVVDNGPENKSDRIRKLVLIGMEPMYCKARHAQGKPYIERLNRSLKEGLQTLPGCTRFDGKDGKRDPIKLKDKLITLEDLEREVVSWYYRDWANTELERHVRSDFQDVKKLGETPAKRWKTMEEMGYPTPLPPSRDEWLRTLYERHTKMLNRRTGVTHLGFNFKGDNLGYLIRKYGEVQVNILVNPDDYRQIFVDEGDGVPLVPLTEEFVNLASPAYTFTQMQQQLKNLKESYGQSEEQMAFRRGLRERSQLSIGQSPGRKRKSEQNKETKARSKESAALQRAAKNPLPIPREEALPLMTSFANALDDIAALPILDRKSGKELK